MWAGLIRRLFKPAEPQQPVRRFIITQDGYGMWRVWPNSRVLHMCESMAIAAWFSDRTFGNKKQALAAITDYLQHQENRKTVHSETV